MERSIVAPGVAGIPTSEETGLLRESGASVSASVSLSVLLWVLLSIKSSLFTSVNSSVDASVSVIIVDCISVSPLTLLLHAASNKHKAIMIAVTKSIFLVIFSSLKYFRIIDKL